MDTIANNLMTIVGGDFSPPALGPEAYNEMLEHLRAHAEEYLDAFEERFLGTNFDALLQSRLYLPNMLRLLHDVAPDRVKQIALRLLNQYNAVMVVYDQVDDKSKLQALVPEQTQNLFLRLEDRRALLRKLIEDNPA